MRKSITFKLTVSFMIVFLISIVIGSLMSYYGSEINNVENLEVQLTRILEESKEQLYRSELSITALEKLSSDNYLMVEYVENLESFTLEKEDLNQLNNNATIQIRSKNHKHERITSPVSIVKYEDAYLISYANFDNLGFSTRDLVMQINIRSLIIGSFLFIFVAGLLINPIKDLIEAVEKVSKKDFDVHLDTKRNDELGDLIKSFNIMTQELKETEILRDDFISDVSHEFKTPLTSIKGYTKLLNDVSDEERAKYIEIISDETDRLSKLTSNILILNRLDHQDYEDIETFSLDEQIRHTVSMLSSNWEKKNLYLNIDLEEVMYEGIEGLLSQVWFNLLDNAIKFSKDNGKLNISLKNEDHITVMIEDFGIGMSALEKRHLFDKFYKSDLSRSDEGNGLGLSIVKRILEIHGGTISVESKISEGTRFIIKL